ncbi:unnamed protein product [marine sediment metagenome]|uniref:Uncharacterized protein n=1 Tax=marine sediment metagenome TaxID=412755 RepID=X1IQZ7_9ZZZZ
MTEEKEQVYNPYEFAKELGFTEAECQTLAHIEAHATNIRAVARAKGLLPDKKTIALPDKVESKPDSQAEGKKHRHHYRKDGTCRCGAVWTLKK